jgi:hypothetical protein
MKTKFLRMKHIIRTLNEDGTFEDQHYTFKLGKNALPSINAAKRASRALQEANGGMGAGSLRVVEKLPSADPVGLRENVEVDMTELEKVVASRYASATMV